MADVSKLETKLKEKQNETKFTTEEMSKLDEVRNSYATIQQNFGQTAMIKLRLEEQIKELNTRVESLKTEYLEVQKNEETFLTEHVC